MRVNYAIVYVSDMQRSVAFYRDAVGLPLRFESPGWTEFATGGATLALHASEGSSSGKSQHDRNAGTCNPGLGVPSLKDFHEKMLANNVSCIREPEQTFGVWIAQYADPDGLIISVAEERRA